jgi:mono/diheme cytochrome c family protein
MKANGWISSVLLAAAAFTGCGHRQANAPALKAKASGTAIVVVSGDKQLGNTGSRLSQPIVVQINDDQGNAVPGASVQLSSSGGVVFEPAQVLTDDSGQATIKVTLGGIAGRYELTASSWDAHGKSLTVPVTEYAAGYQQEVGYEVNQKYCSRCHDSESTVEQVSNYDNLAVKPQSFASGDALNKLSDTDLTNIIEHGGPAMNRSALMPPYGWTLNKSEVQAVIAYIRLVSDPPYTAPGVVYAKH